MLGEVFQKIWDDQNGGLDQYQLRDKAFAAIDRADYGDALHESLLNDAYAFILGKRSERPASGGQSRGSVSTGTYSGKPARRTAGTANSARSSKYAKLRQQWPMLRCSYSVAHGQRKNLESMNAEECRHAATVNRALSDGNLRRAEWLERISTELIDNGAPTVAKLPAAVLDELQNTAP